MQQAFRAWGGRRPDGTNVNDDVSEETGPKVDPVSITPKDLASMMLLVLGFAALAVSLGALLGWAGVLLAIGVVFVPVGIILGLSD